MKLPSFFVSISEEWLHYFLFLPIEIVSFCYSADMLAVYSGNAWNRYRYRQWAMNFQAKMLRRYNYIVHCNVCSFIFIMVMKNIVKSGYRFHCRFLLSVWLLIRQLRMTFSCKYQMHLKWSNWTKIHMLHLLSLLMAELWAMLWRMIWSITSWISLSIAHRLFAAASLPDRKHWFISQHSSSLLP